MIIILRTDYIWVIIIQIMKMKKNAPSFIPERGLQFDYKYLSIRESQKTQEPCLAGLKQI